MAPLQPLEFAPFTDAGVRCQIKREDLLHPALGGNKLFKLLPYLAVAQDRPLASYGGAFSNHLLALATACRDLALPCRALVRGVPSGAWSPTLLDLQALGADLVFVERTRFRELTAGAAPTSAEVPPDYRVIPQGGDGIEGAAGARAWVRRCLAVAPGTTHLWLAVGTGTTLAGAIAAASERTPPPVVVGVWALKASASAAAEFRQQVASRVRALGARPGPWQLLDQYHGGGFGKFPPALRAAADALEAALNCPLDPVYTAKLLVALQAELGSAAAPRGAEVLLLHTGGLQGRRGLAAPIAPH